MAQNFTNFASMLKQVYRQSVISLLNNEVEIWTRWNTPPKERFAGKPEGIKWPLILGRTQAFGAYRAGGPLPEAQHTPTGEMTVPIRFHGGRFGLDTPTMKLSKESRGAFASAYEFETERFRESFIDYMNELLWGDGRGILATVTTNGADTTALAVRNPGNVTGTVDGSRFLQPTMRIAILSSDGSSLLAVRRVESVDADGLGVVLNSAVSATQAPAGALIVRAPSLNVNDVIDVSFNNSMMGMLGIVDDGTFLNDYFGQNRTTQPLARANVFSGVGALNLDTIQQAHDVAEKLGRGRITEHWMEHAVRRSFLALTVANRRFVSSGGPTNFDPGFKGAMIEDNPTCNGKPIKVDKDAPYGMWFGMDWREAVKFPLVEFEFANEDGAILARTPGVDAFEGVARLYANVAHGKPLSCFRLDGISHNHVQAHVR